MYLANVKENLVSDNIDYKMIKLKNNPCAIRDGRARERKIAIKEIQSRIS
jgi:hypothetical protein